MKNSQDENNAPTSEGTVAVIVEMDGNSVLPGGDRLSKTVLFPHKDLAQKIKDTVGDFAAQFDEQITSEHFEIDTLELSVSVSSEGGIKLVGSLSAASNSGIKVILKRKSKN